MIPKSIGRYEIKKELGRGGMATVFLAEDPRFARKVAVKVLPAQFAIDPQFIARFKREAEAIASLEHVAIVPVHDYGEESDQPYLVMRYMPGGTLRDRLNKGKLSASVTLEILERISPALDKAHRQGVVHRDLKPENILFDEDGAPFISDFGIAKLTERATQFTSTGIIGTPAYMSPEQASGNDLDGRSDLYSLAVILHEMLSGKTLFKAKTPMAIMVAHINEPAPPLSKVQKGFSTEVDKVLGKALSKRPSSRYKTAASFVQALRQAGLSVSSSRQKSSLGGQFRVASTKGIVENDEAAPVTKLLGGHSTKAKRPAVPVGNANLLKFGLPLVFLFSILLGWSWVQGRQQSTGDSLDEPTSIDLAAVVSPSAGLDLTPTAGADLVAFEDWADVTLIQFEKPTQLAWSSEGKLAVFSSDTRTLQIWSDSNSDETGVLISISAYEKEAVFADISAFAFSPDGERLAIVDHNGNIRILSTTEYEELTSFFIDEAVDQIDWSPLGTLLAFKRDNGRFSDIPGVFGIYDLSVNQVVYTSSLVGRQVGWSFDGAMVAILDAASDVIRVVNVKKGYNTSEIQLTYPEDAIWSDRENLLAISRSGVNNAVSVRIYDVDRLVNVFTIVEVPFVSSPDFSVSANLNAYVFTWSPDGKYVAIPSGENYWQSNSTERAIYDEYVMVWDVELRRLQTRFPVDIHAVYETANEAYALSWHPASTCLAALTKMGDILIWHTAKQIELISFPSGFRLASGFVQLAWSPDGAKLAAFDSGNQVKVWSTSADCAG
ncbi:MAG: WD40 repeat domain-containing serine/threonine protein kinase [Anaerolineales bacterium]